MKEQMKIEDLIPIDKSEKVDLTGLFDISNYIPVYHSDSKINGIGVFTPIELQDDEFVGVSHVFYKGFWYMTAHGNYNHSDNPNCILEVENNVLIMKANQYIKHGEELTVDYREQKFLEQPEEGWVK